MGVSEYEVRDGIYYTREHDWIKVEGELARVGITDYAQNKLGDVVYIELPAVGKTIKQVLEPKSRDMEIGAVESVKAVSTIYSPVSGTIKELNTTLQERPEIINSSPYDEGWICIITPTNLQEELKNLIGPGEYSEYIKTL